jgi:hypothetical protein
MTLSQHVGLDTDDSLVPQVLPPNMQRVDIFLSRHKSLLALVVDRPPF